MWKSKRNVSITYTALPSSTPATIKDTAKEHSSNGKLKLDDLVQYQPLNSDSWKKVEGIDTQAGDSTGEWNWRGKGWLIIAGSHWEVLGWGRGFADQQSGDARGEGDDEEHNKGQWAVTYFAKTLFTPAGIDVYARDPAGLGEELVEEIKEALTRSEDEGVKKLAGGLFEVKIG